MIIWFVIIGVGVYLIMGGNLNLGTFQRKSPSDHLKERLAKGELSIEEYQKLKYTIKENE